MYETETQRHAADHRHYTADNYGSHNAYATSYGGSYGNYPPPLSPLPPYHAGPVPLPSSSLPPSSLPPSHPVPVAPRSAPTATPRRIIYYASLPDPAPAPLHPQLHPHPQPQLHPQPQPQPQAPAGSARVPHEYRGPPYDVNGAYSQNARYPPVNDNPYRYSTKHKSAQGRKTAHSKTNCPSS